MKKTIVLSIVALLVLSISVISFAESKVDTPNWFKEMITWKKEQINEAVKEGNITKEEAQVYTQRIENMEKYHEENGFDFPNGCRMGQNNGNGLGRGAGSGCGNGFGRMNPISQ